MKQLAKSVASNLAWAGFGAWGIRRRTTRASRPVLDEVRSILVIRLNLIGDLLFTLPAVAALRSAAPEARITALVLPYTAELLRGSDLVDRVVVADVNRWRRPAEWLTGRAVREVRAVVTELQREPCDLSVSFYGQAGAAFGLLGGAAYTIGYRGEGFPFSFDLAVPGSRYDAPRHEAEYCLDLVRALGVSAVPKQPKLSLGSTPNARMDAMLADAGAEPGRPLVVLHPGALNMAAKRWFTDRWAAVADRIQQDLGGKVLLVGSSAELPLAEAVRREMRSRPAMLAGQTSIAELAALLRRSDLFLGGDSGPLHLAAALGVPSVSVYGPTDPANTGPLGQNTTVLRGSAPCMPCYALKRPPACWRGDLLCMSQVTVDKAFEAARQMIAVSNQESAISNKSSVISHQPPGHRTLRTARQEPRPPEHGTQHSVLLKRILVVKLAGIGDLLTAFPAMEAIRRHYPHAEITALVTPQSAEVLRGSGLANTTILLDKYIFDTTAGLASLRSLRGLAQLAVELRSRSFDAVVLLHHLITPAGIAKYALLTMASRARIRAGLDDGRGWFLNVTARDQGFGTMHEVDYWLEVARLLDASNPEPSIRMVWGSEEEDFADRAWQSMGLPFGRDVVALHPGTGSYSPARRWHPDRFAAVASALADDGLMPMVVAGPGEEELAREVADTADCEAVILTGTPTPRHLAAVLSRCRLFVGNDSGVMHVAAAAGVPAVGIFGPSNHRAWAPYDPTGKRTTVVRTDLLCSPCLYRGQTLGLRNGCGDPQCLDRTDPARVVEAARDLLRRT